MKKNCYTILSCAVIMLLSLQKVQGAVVVPLDDPNMRYDGAFYNVVTPTLVTFNRHQAAVYNNVESGIYGSWINQWVITQTGIRVRFKTTSPTITLTFQKRTGGGSIGTSPTNGFSVFANGNLINTYSSLSFTINNPSAGNATLYEVSLPNLWAVDLIGMSIDDTHALDDPGTLSKPIYVAIGDSKTHGTGQYVSSAKTYPFQLANLMGWDLHNIAVAGSTLGWAMALNIKNQSVDVLTIELGYNDWEYLSTNLATMQHEYERLIDSIRLYQPTAKIFCITPIVTTDPSGAAPYTLDAYRNMVQNIVSIRMQNDPKIFVIPGPSVSDAGMLASGDVVHLSEGGALTLAQNLVAPITNPSSIVLTTTATGEAIETAKKKIFIKQLNNVYLTIVIEEEGNYNVNIYTTNGTLVDSKNDTYLNRGDNTIFWKSSSIKSGSLYLIRIQKGTDALNELKYVE
ncbi:MAG: SGNH/GDSL hydrolase family protein [Cytophagaceae bacterium]|nr:SGNH/GDSL hydrolase family protein [Cytophagaceae bacterium]